MATQEKTWNVANRLHSQKDSDNPEVNHIIAGADEIYDDTEGARQSDINAQVDGRLDEVETDLNASGEGIKDRVHTLEEQVAFEGEFEVENTPQGIVTGSGKVTSANAVRGAIDVRTGYFECTTASGTAAKEISAPGFVLSAGGSIKIKMANANTADNATLDINSTDAKALYYAGERASSINTWEAGETVEVYYDGTSYYANSVAGGSSSGDGAFDVSAKYPTSGVDGGNTYTLAGALAVLNANLSANKKKGGMSIKFIQSSDNKYVQYRLMSTLFSTNEDDWTENGSGSGDGAYDISKNHSGATYDNLATALGTNGANVQANKRKGGMSVKFVQNIYATYSVVKTEGLDTEPTGTELQSASAITDGVYTAAQLSDLNIAATLPATVNSSVTYYFAASTTETVDEEEVTTTTYTKWVVTKATDDSGEYVQWRYMGTSIANADFVKVESWQGVDTQLAYNDNLVINRAISEEIAPTQKINIPFSVAERYVNGSGVISSNWSYKSTAFIEVKKGDIFLFSGYSGPASIAVSCFKYDSDTNTYIFVNSLLGVVFPDNRAKNAVCVVTDDRVTHVISSCNNNITKFEKIQYSTLSKIKEDLNGLSYTNYGRSIIPGNYVYKDGTWSTSSDFGYFTIDVKEGDVVEVYNFTKQNSNVCGLSEKLSDTPTFRVIDQINTTSTINYTYTATKTMTICFSCAYYRFYIHKSNKLNSIDGISELLNTTRSEIAERNTLEDHYDLKFGYMFNNIAVIGDSMSVGSISTVDEAAPNSNFGASWLSVLAKRWGCISRQHYAQGGTSTWSWLNTDNYGLYKMLNDSNVYNCYLIAYGHNDGMAVGTAADEASTITMTDGHPSTPTGQTFCAYYKAIVNQIRTKAPHAMIFCLSEYDNVIKYKSDGIYRQAVIDVADWFYEQGDHLIYHLETGGVPDSNMELSSHYSTQGYFHIAMRIDQEVNKVIYAHRSDIQVKEFGIYNNVNAGYSAYTITQG